ncbi:MAG: hypothetical protein ACYSWZ_20510 [Planctomycetota bacterium]
MKKILDLHDAGRNLLKPQAWKPWQKGYEQQGNVFYCNNGPDVQVQRGISQTIILNQTKPEPIVAVAWSKAEGVGGGRKEVAIVTILCIWILSIPMELHSGAGLTNLMLALTTGRKLRSSYSRKSRSNQFLFICSYVAIPVRPGSVIPHCV